MICPRNLLRVLGSEAPPTSGSCLEAQGDRNGQEWTGDGDMMHGKSHVCQPSLITAAGQGMVQIIFYLFSFCCASCFLREGTPGRSATRAVDMDECMKGRKAKRRNSRTTAFQEVPTFVLSHCLIVCHHLISSNQVLLVGWTPCYIPRWGAIADVA